MFQRKREQFFGWLYFFVFVFLFLFTFFGYDIYQIYFKPSELELYMEAYEKTYGKKMEIPDYLRETLPKHKQ